MARSSFLLLFVLFAFAFPLKAEEVKQIPAFADYATEQSAFTSTTTLDVSKYEDKFYKNLLKKEFSKEADLANNYSVLSVTCGANCQTNFIANKQTGEIIGNIGTTLDLDYNVNSSLLVADQYTLPLDKPFYQNPVAGDVRFYIIQDNEVVLLTQISQQDYYNLKKSELNNAD